MVGAFCGGNRGDVNGEVSTGSDSDRVLSGRSRMCEESRPGRYRSRY
jgi:hypothetical protein